ncbi:Heme oxygenase [Xylanimonas cellulosilytica DSM 15894]|uniref:Heme oxygenase n=1 Tax=Xylanimonas cellulosilytica (strain DSM 15894 / JCM 12276 / CECT 5975 / KCTC 9989 / LMG 20990 / NBRC 107835 / XIL07) TaxID=446471 RepID=D1BXY1_XYLCX|nr:biliverdin-producing heme oxygenase [Xylanimonas cellulosilytica]ACZ31772.1 Heme oxygenase [Xylanimonas cellulosilytica DSM 15894]
MTVAPVAPPLLSALLREGTRTEHQEAESQGFVTRLLAGELSVAAYASLAAQQHTIYTALEEASAQIASDARGGALVFAELTRVPAIERDLEHLYGPEWRDAAAPLPSTARYAARLREAGAGLPEYAAHAYTRYLGDLSGGQVIKRMMQRHYGMGAAGLEFYEFPEIPKAKPFKDVYRERLDGLGLDDTETSRAVAEAQRAFQLNRAMFAELGALHP